MIGDTAATVAELRYPGDIGVLVDMRPATTDAAPTAAASSAHPGLTIPADLNQQRIKHWPVLGGLINVYERTA